MTVDTDRDEVCREDKRELGYDGQLEDVKQSVCEDYNNPKAR